ncbi:MAG: carbamate kinase [Clostridiales bacterium]|nr:carbamate kinase [Clostridiales bacterium]
MGKIVIALGGNALQSGKGEATAEAQLEVVKKTCAYIAELSDMGYEIGLVHGNGPQVGRILLATEAANDITPAMPFDVCGAMSQGYIGYHLQQALGYELKKRGKDTPVLTVVTQVVVDAEDPGFKDPTKPIGPFYSAEAAKAVEAEKGYVLKEDSGRGFRRVVASPIPEDIVEIDAVRRLWDSSIVITCGGGGIPVVRSADGKLEGVPAVIDKDYAAELLAEKIGADALMILTEVEQVAINFNKPNQENLSTLDLVTAQKYVDEGQFAPGSMLPKVKAAMKFVEANPGKKAIITSLDKAVEALAGNTGTVIVNK